MSPDEFVRAIKQVVFDAAIEDTIEVLLRPPGRCPEPELSKVSEWFTKLSAEDKEMVRRIVKIAAHYAIFGFLAVIDGVRQIERSGIKGQLKLLLVTPEREWPLNPSTGLPLHDLFNEELSRVN